MTSIAQPRTTPPSYDSVTLRQRNAQPFLIPPRVEDGAPSLPRIRLHICIDDVELRTAVHSLFDEREPFEVVTGSLTFSAGARVRVGRLGDDQSDGIPVDGTPIVLIGPDLKDDTILAAVRAGAWAYVSEQGSSRELLAAVEQAADGQCPILRTISDRPSAAACLISQLAKPEPSVPMRQPLEASPLTESETEILRRVANGFNTREIAGDLGFQEQTIKNRLTGIFNKLGPRSRAGAVAEAQRHGWL